MAKLPPSASSVDPSAPASPEPCSLPSVVCVGVWLAPLAVIPAVLALAALSVPAGRAVAAAANTCCGEHLQQPVTVPLCPSPCRRAVLHTPHLAEPSEGTAATFLPPHKVPSQPLGAGLSSAQLNGNTQPQGFLEGKSSWLMIRLFFLLRCSNTLNKKLSLQCLSCLLTSCSSRELR